MTDFLEEQQAQGVWDHVTDGFAGGVRGIAAAGASFYDLGDAIYTNTVGRAFDRDSTFASLPDLPQQKDTFLGESRTLTGSIVEGITQFATGFIPVAGWLGKGGHLFGTSLAGGLKNLPLVRGAAAGAAADFIAFDGQEQRLSNLLQEFPQLRGPVTDFLAADEADGEIEGRFKNALEGLAIGTLTDTLILPLKAIRAHRTKVAGGADPENASKEITEKINGEEVHRHVITATDEEFHRMQAVLEETPGQVFEPMGLDDAAIETLFKEVLPPRLKELSGKAPINPRIDFVEALKQKIDRGEINMTMFPKGHAAEFQRALSGKLEAHLSKFVTENKIPVSMEESWERGMTLLSDAAGLPRQTYESLLRQRSGVLMQDTASLSRMIANVQAGQATFELLGKQLKDLDAKIRNQDASPKDMLEGAFMLEEFKRVNAGLQGVATGTGRLLRQFGGPVRSMSDKVTKELTALAGGEKGLKKTIQRVAEVMASEDGGLAGVARAAEQYHVGMSMTIEYWLNSVLSGGRTHAVNILANTAVTLYRPLERMLGGALGAVFGSDTAAARRTFHAGARTYLGFMQNIKEALSYTGTALKTGDPVLEGAGTGKLAGQTTGTRHGSLLGAEGLARLQGKDPNFYENAMVRGPADFLGGMVTMPSRLLTTADEFFKQLNYRSTLQTELYLSGLDQGYSKEAAAQWARTKMDGYFTNGQRRTQQHAFAEGVKGANKMGLEPGTEEYTEQVMKVANDQFNPDIAARALYDSQEATQTLPAGELVTNIQSFISMHPAAKFVLPFVNVSTNIIKFAGRRVDLAGLSAAKMMQTNPDFIGSRILADTNNQLVRDIYSNDPRKKYEAAGRLSVGFSTTALFIGLASSGRITGSGPKDKNHRALMEQTGWQPYSMKIGDKWVSYERADPMAILMGLAADTAMYGQYTDVEDEQGVAALMTGMTMAIAKNITNKSYLAGVTNLAQVMSDPERHGNLFLSNFLGGFVPFSTALNQAQDVVDPVTREAIGLKDRLWRKIPGLSEDLPAIRNILGEEVHAKRSLFDDEEKDFSPTNFFVPIQYKTVKDDFVWNQLNELGHAFSPPSRKSGGLDLTTVKSLEGGVNAYDRYQVLSGKISIGGSTLKQALKRLFKSKGYARMDSEQIGDQPSERVRAVNAVIGRYRRAALRQLTTEVPELQELEEQRRLQRAGISPFLTQ